MEEGQWINSVVLCLQLHLQEGTGVRGTGASSIGKSKGVNSLKPGASGLISINQEASSSCIEVTIPTQIFGSKSSSA